MYTKYNGYKTIQVYNPTKEFLEFVKSNFNRYAYDEKSENFSIGEWELEELCESFSLEFPEETEYTLSSMQVFSPINVYAEILKPKI